ncbi:MAG TPA: HAD family hydrolase [Candidatus Tectomicrobia bacterium]|nr:HAD family hydrolase [Candidatus Tectomicrobia bacterium]
MAAVKGIGFDLFGTLVLQKRFSFEQCIDALLSSLLTDGFALEKETFVATYRQVNRQFMDRATVDGRETHNRLWVAGALQALGYAVEPEDARVEQAVECYFEPFIRSCELIPDTYDMLQNLAGRYRLGVISNFTHPPAVEQILARVGLVGFFDEILISGQLGIRKPHPGVFAELTKRLALAPAEIVFVGDELQADILGAQKAGMRTVWMTYRQRLERPSPLGQFLGMAEAAEGIQPDYMVASWSEFLATLP